MVVKLNSYIYFSNTQNQPPMKKLFYIVILLFASTLTNAQTPVWEWAQRAGSVGRDAGGYVKTDAQGNIYVGGGFNDTISFGAITLISYASQATFFIAKYDPSGNALWAKMGMCISGFISGLTIDDSSNVVVAGEFWTSEMIIGSDTLINANPPAPDMFIAKYDSNGNVLWAKREGGSLDDSPSEVVCDHNGDIYMTGSFVSDTLNLDTIPLVNSGVRSLFVVKYDPAGNVMWARGSSGPASDQPTDIKVDANGNVIVAGTFTSSVMTLGATVLNNQGGEDIFIAKYNSSGTLLWGKRYGAASYDKLRGLALYNGDIYIAGDFNGSTAFDTVSLMSGGDFDIFLAGLNSSGDVTWAKRAGGTSGDRANDITCNANGSIYITGFFSSTSLTFGNTSLSNGAPAKMYIARYDVAGNVIWATSSSGTTSVDYGVSVDADLTGAVYVTGFFQRATSTFGGYMLENAEQGTYDVFFAKLTTLTPVNEISDISNMVVFPNPSHQQFTISLNYINADAAIEIYSALGNKVAAEITSNNSSKEIQLNNAPPGIYLVKVVDKEKTYSEKIIIE